MLSFTHYSVLKSLIIIFFLFFSKTIYSQSVTIYIVDRDDFELKNIETRVVSQEEADTEYHTLVLVYDSFRKEFLKLQAKEARQEILNNINWDAVKRYVFFDTECANCFDGKGKICEFGWAASSSNFQGVNKGEYIINPGKGTNFRFALIGRKNQDDLHLKYENNNYEAYRQASEFDNYIGNINFLFNQKDILIFGFEVKNDFSYLDYSYKRYGYKPLNIFAIDVRILYKKLLKETGSLETIIKKYLPQEVTSSIIVHESSYDAIATMLALKFLINKFSVSLKDLIKEVGYECIISSKWDVEVTKLNVEERELKDCIFKLKKKIKKPFDKLRSDRKKDEKYISALLEPSFAGKNFLFLIVFKSQI